MKKYSSLTQGFFVFSAILSSFCTMSARESSSVISMREFNRVVRDNDLVVAYVYNLPLKDTAKRVLANGTFGHPRSWKRVKNVITIFDEFADKSLYHNVTFIIANTERNDLDTLIDTYDLVEGVPGQDAFLFFKKGALRVKKTIDRSGTNVYDKLDTFLTDHVEYYVSSYTSIVTKKAVGAVKSIVVKKPVVKQPVVRKIYVETPVIEERVVYVEPVRSRPHFHLGFNVDRDGVFPSFGFGLF